MIAVAGGVPLSGQRIAGGIPVGERNEFGGRTTGRRFLVRGSTRASWAQVSFTDATITTTSPSALTSVLDLCCRGPVAAELPIVRVDHRTAGRTRRFAVSAVAWLVVVLVLVVLLVVIGLFVRHRRRAGGVIATRPKR